MDLSLFCSNAKLFVKWILSEYTVLTRTPSVHVIGWNGVRLNSGNLIGGCRASQIGRRFLCPRTQVVSYLVWRSQPHFQPPFLCPAQHKMAGWGSGLRQTISYPDPSASLDIKWRMGLVTRLILNIVVHSTSTNQIARCNHDAHAHWGGVNTEGLR